MSEIKNVVLVGSGNMATHLGLALHGAGKNILQVISRKLENARKLAEKIDSVSLDDIGKISPQADLVILSVSDFAISGMAEKMKLKDQLLVHTSGVVPMEILQTASENTGVLYPLSTFSKHKGMNFDEIEIFVEAAKKENQEKLLKLAGEISKKVYLLSGEQRKIVHLAAVYASNFTNQMYRISEMILKEYGLDFELMRPIILETAKKVQDSSPSEVQTGPAVREDINTIAEHLDLLRKHPELTELYKRITYNIIHFKDKS